MAWRLASLGRGSALLWLRTGLALLVDPVGFPPLRMGLRGETGVAAPPEAALLLHFRHQRVGNLEVRGDVLHVVVVLQRADEAQDLLARLVVDGDRGLRPPDD
jgi:hypothetical protein